MPEKKYVVTMTEVDETPAGPPAKRAEGWFVIALLVVAFGGAIGRAIGL